MRANLRISANFRKNGSGVFGMANEQKSRRYQGAERLMMDDVSLHRSITSGLHQEPLFCVILRDMAGISEARQEL